MTLARLHNILILLILSLYIVLNYGFMQVRFPPGFGGGIPVGELALLFSLVIIDYLKLLPRLSAVIFLIPFLIWWGYGLGRAVAGVPEHGLWALRDATHVIESLFLIVGFVFASRTQAINQFFSWLPRILMLTCIYALGRLSVETLQSFSPKLTGGAGHQVPLFFSYLNTGPILLMAAAYLMLFKRPGVKDKLAIITATFLTGYSVFVFQMRSIYLQVIAIALLFAVYRKELLGKGFVMVFVLAAALTSMPLLGLQVEGRLGQTISGEFLVNHFLAIGGVAGPGVEEAASGVDLRLDWWWTLYDRWTADVGSFLFGLGYGIPLVDFVYAVDSEEGVPIREPHNSYISVVARLGLVGGIAFVWMHILLLRTWHRTYDLYTRMRWREGQSQLLILMVFFVLVWVYAIGEDAFEKPYFAIPYYFFWGIVLQMYRRSREVYSEDQKH